MPKHALLSASASHRWLNCPPSAKLCADIKDEASPYAKQGTDAHSLCEFKVLTALGQHPPDPTDDLDYFDQEMAYCTDEYCSYVMEQLTEAKTHCKDPQVLVEQRLDFSKWIPEGFGTGDCLIVADDVLHKDCSHAQLLYPLSIPLQLPNAFSVCTILCKESLQSSHLLNIYSLPGTK